MRAIRTLAVAALVALDVSAAAAQSTRHFKDSWFWGLKAGETFYQVQSHPNGLAPLGGIDWLITRTNGGLYVSFDHSFLTRDSVFVNDSISPLDTVPRTVNLSGLRRFTLAGMLFPMQSYRLHPYFGLGVALHHIAKATPRGPYRNGTQQQLVLATVQQFRSAASPVVIMGAQYRLLRFSVFGQATATPANENFFLFTGSNWRTTVEGGLRYNVGSSIDRMR